MNKSILSQKSIPRQHPLKTLLKKRRISQAQAALALGISRPHLNQLLLGQAPISPELTEKLNLLETGLREAKNGK